MSDMAGKIEDQVDHSWVVGGLTQVSKAGNGLPLSSITSPLSGSPTNKLTGCAGGLNTHLTHTQLFNHPEQLFKGCHCCSSFRCDLVTAYQVKPYWVDPFLHYKAGQLVRHILCIQKSVPFNKYPYFQHNNWEIAVVNDYGRSDKLWDSFFLC